MALKAHHGRALDAATWKTLLDDFDRMAIGQNENGEVLCRDSSGREWNFVLLFGQGDMEQLCQSWGLPHYNDIRDICAMCLANRDRDGNNFTDLQDDASWRPTCPLPNHVLAKC